MKKFTKVLAAIMLMMAVVITLGCNKKPENPGQTVTLTGLWYANDQWIGNEHDRAAMDFVNSNTVIWYGTVSTNKNAFQNMEGTALDGCAGWYYFSKTYYTYVLTDNKIFFNDRIFTIFEDYLVEDGSSSQWKPWDNGNGGGGAPATVTVTTYNPTDITSTEATCCADVTAENGSNIRELGICWGTSAYPTVENSHLSTTTWNTPFVCTISDLVPETRYHVRAYALNGSSYVYGDDKSFTTLSEGGGGGQTYTITATANPSNGGMVIGSGTYQEGQQCTLIATANSGYDFVNWTENGTEVSLDLNYAFTVSANRTLLANFISSGSGNAPEGAINGKFSVNENGDQVFFSQGNLQYIGSAGNGDENNTGAYWKFAENQWEYLGDNGQGGSSKNVDRDLFGWGTSGYHNPYDNFNTNYQPWCTSGATNVGEYNKTGYGPSINMPDPNLTGTSAEYDWGVHNAIINGGNTTHTWRTLTIDEWEYVFFTRSASMVSGVADARFARGMVNGTAGVIIFPDIYSHPDFIPYVVQVNDENADYTLNGFSADAWAVMESLGCVFLPAAGYRLHSTLLYQGKYGNYWSASYDEANSRSASVIDFVDPAVGIMYGGRMRFFGNSVRLVCPAE